MSEEHMASRVLAQGGQRQAETDAPMTPADVLEKAADLLEKPGAWAQHDFALDANGFAVDYRSGDAVCWCARGAIGAVNDNDDSAAVHRLWGIAAALLGFAHFNDIEEWNDEPSRTQSEVVSALRKAAELGRGKNG